MKYIGGYSILDLTDANVSAQANACYNQDKPVLVYGANGERYFADTITKSGSSIIVTKGGKTITIANDNTITNVGDINDTLKTYQCYITGEGDDSNSHDIRFILYSSKVLNNDNIVDYFKSLVSSDDWSFIGYDTDNTTLFVVFSIDANTINTRDCTNSTDITFNTNTTTIEVRRLN